MQDRIDSSTNVLRGTAVVPYEHKLRTDPEWALAEGSRHFDEQSAVYATLRKFAQRLEELGIPYAIAGGMALFQHGLRRFTEDVDVLVTRDGLLAIHRELDGRGYVPPFERSKNLRDTELGVRIEFLITGEYPGDGKPKPVAFPDPERVATERGGLQVVNLPALVELKLASGMTNPQRMKDLADVQELIKTLRLPAAFSTQLNLYVQPKFTEIWMATTAAPQRYFAIWRTGFATQGEPTLDEVVEHAKRSDDRLRAMVADGVEIDAARSTADGSIYLVTSDPTIAKKYAMHNESESWPADSES